MWLYAHCLEFFFVKALPRCKPDIVVEKCFFWLVVMGNPLLLDELQDTLSCAVLGVGMNLANRVSVSTIVRMCLYFLNGFMIHD